MTKSSPLACLFGRRFFRSRLRLRLGSRSLARLGAVGEEPLAGGADQDRQPEVVQPVEVREQSPGLRGVLREAGVLVLFGAAGGLVAGYLGARVLESIMTGAGTFDPVVSLLIAVGLALLSIVAAWVPARRAAGVDPVIALRS